jgi:signal transduction histidine kinase
MKIDWLEKLRIYLQTVAFCLAVAAVQVAFQPQKPYELPLVYSLCIGTSMWALIDFGRHLFPSAAVTGWPQGIGGTLLPVGSIVGAYFLGTLAGDRWFGWSSWDTAAEARSQLPVSILVTVVAGIVATGYFYSRTKAAWLETKMSEARHQAAESRLKLLEAQIEPHMLFNTLANLRALIPADPERAQVMLDHLINYLRATLSASRVNAGSHTLQSEFDRLQDYLALMAIRMGPRLRYTLTLPPQLARQPVPPLLLQPIVENAIKHGLEPQVQGGAIAVTASLANGLLTLDVTDTGVGPATANGLTDTAALADPSGKTGFGLAQVRERLQTLHSDQATLQLRANPGGGTRVSVSLPA